MLRKTTRKWHWFLYQHRTSIFWNLFNSSTPQKPRNLKFENSARPKSGIHNRSRIEVKHSRTLLGSFCHKPNWKSSYVLKQLLKEPRTTLNLKGHQKRSHYWHRCQQSGARNISPTRYNNAVLWLLIHLLTTLMCRKRSQERGGDKRRLVLRSPSLLIWMFPGWLRTPETPTRNTRKAENTLCCIVAPIGRWYRWA